MFSTSVCLYIGLCVRTSHAPNNYFMYMVAIHMLSLWEKAALSSDEYVAGRTYRCITNSPFALLCMSG